MDDHTTLLGSLLAGLAENERAAMLRRLEQARDEQLHSKQDPPRRRRRDSAGVLVELEGRQP